MAAPLKINWGAVVEQIRAGDPVGEETLYRALASGARLFLRRRLGSEDVDDRLHDLFVIVIEAIQSGTLREPERLMGFVRTVLHRQLALGISQRVQAREAASLAGEADGVPEPRANPEQAAISQEECALMKRVLRELSERDFEVLMRCYLREQSPEQVRSQMSLSAPQLDLIKSRAKARLKALLQKRLARHNPNRQ